MRIIDWSSDVCSSDLGEDLRQRVDEVFRPGDALELHFLAVDDGDRAGALELGTGDTRTGDDDGIARGRFVSRDPSLVSDRGRASDGCIRLLGFLRPRRRGEARRAANDGCRQEALTGLGFDIQSPRARMSVVRGEMWWGG